MSFDQRTAESLIPLREPTFFILVALAGSKKHGYAILQDVKALSEGRLRLSTGTLYGALARLLEQGIISQSLEESEGMELDPHARKVYMLTRFGRRVLEAEMGRLQGLLAAARQELGEQET